jgi:hypothetical protein
MPPDFLTQFSRAPLAACPMVVGGVACTASGTAMGLSVLLAAPGLMIRQPLARAGSPLAGCDYHAVAAPYKARFLTAVSGEPLRRGAAGRHIAKQAFCMALADQLAGIASDPWAVWESLAARAWQAFAADPGYATAIAAAASAAGRRGVLAAAV